MATYWRITAHGLKVDRYTGHLYISEWFVYRKLTVLNWFMWGWKGSILKNLFEGVEISREEFLKHQKTKDWMPSSPLFSSVSKHPAHVKSVGRAF